MDDQAVYVARNVAPMRLERVSLRASFIRILSEPDGEGTKGDRLARRLYERAAVDGNVDALALALAQTDAPIRGDAPPAVTVQIAYVAQPGLPLPTVIARELPTGTEKTASG